MTTSKPSTIHVRIPGGCLAFLAFLILVVLAICYHIGVLNILLTSGFVFFLVVFSFMWPHPARRRWLKGRQWAREVASLAACALLACGFLGALIYRNL